jgi:outer membrane immunogenic protein
MRIAKTAMAALAAAMLTAGGVQAADFLEPIDDVIVDDVFDWTGLYAGLQVGVVWGNVETEDLWCVNFPEDCYGDSEDRYFSDTDLNGIKFGGHIGFHQQFDMLVLGLESDLNWGGGHGTGAFFYYDDSDGEIYPGNPDEFVDFDMLWEGSTRLKFGVALDRWMPYVTGGIAYGQADVLHHLDWDPDVDLDGTVNLIGYTVGIGAAYAVTDQIFVHGEARYTDYGTSVGTGVDPDMDMYSFEIVGPKTVSLEAGVSFKF